MNPLQQYTYIYHLSTELPWPRDAHKRTNTEFHYINTEDVGLCKSPVGHFVHIVIHLTYRDMCELHRTVRFVIFFNNPYALHATRFLTV